METKINIIYMIGVLIISIIVPFLAIHINYKKQKVYDEYKNNIAIQNALLLIKDEIRWNTLYAIRTENLLKEQNENIFEADFNITDVFKNDSWCLVQQILVGLDDKQLFDRVITFYNNLNTLKAFRTSVDLNYMRGLIKIGSEIDTYIKSK